MNATLEAQVAWLVERERKKEELLAEMTPILREVMSTATTKLADYEKRGWFDSGRELARVIERVLDHYRPEDVRALGDAIITILDTIRAMTQPDVLAVVGEAAQGLARADEVAPIGLYGMVRASRNADVQKGMAVLMDLLRHVGRATTAVAEKGDRKARLAKMLGPRRKKSLGLPAPAACAAPKPAETSTVIDGVAFTAEGNLVDPAAWTRPLAETIAAAEGITLSPDHWKVLDAARADFLERKVAANIRRLSQISGVGTRELYALFPKAPGRTIARIAGTPKPAGCI